MAVLCRCARNCFNCPVCTAPLTVTTLESTADSSGQQGPWILACGYCMWTTLDVGIQFHKPTNIRSQLAKIYEEASGNVKRLSKLGSELKSPPSTMSSGERTDSPDWDDKTPRTETPTPQTQEQVELDPHTRFAALKRFYSKQIEESSVSATDPFSSDFGAVFSSPSALNRIMSIYASSTHFYGGGRKAKSKPPIMREALTPAEGLKIASAEKDRAIIEQIHSHEVTWDDILSTEQRAFQSPDARLVDDLRPLPVLLRTKRSKRCKSCKHILVKPEVKPASTRFRIRLIALSYIPLTTIRPLNFTPLPGQTVSATSALQINMEALAPQRPIQYLLTLKNHMFDPVRVTLATPSVTPGRVQSKVTILCPQFDIGANSDVWDEALQSGSTTGISATSALSKTAGASPGEKVAEAGKVWDKGRNWTTVVVEVVPGTLPGTSPYGMSSDQAKDDEPLEEDEDLLEIPVFVRLEWDSDSHMDSDHHHHHHHHQSDKRHGRDKSTDEGSDKPEAATRELAYWMVLGVGRISSKVI